MKKKYAINQLLLRKNKERVSGKYKKVKWDKFSWFIVTDNKYIHIPTDTFKNKYDYRRPGTYIEPYNYLMTMCKITLNNF
jgi:hypothetical protein